MADGHHVRPHAVEQEMHRQFRGKFAIAGKLTPVHIGDNQVLRREHALIHAGGSRENAAVIEPHGNVSFTGDDVSALVHPAPGDTDLAAVLLFTFRVA
jgi:hypothetical protein